MTITVHLWLHRQFHISFINGDKLYLTRPGINEKTPEWHHHMKTLNEKLVLKYYRAKLKNHHGFHRFSSWDHCYKSFGNERTDLDTLALNLGVYLASWGMYRGSSFLLEFDYKIHVDTARLVRRHSRTLRGISVSELPS